MLHDLVSRVPEATLLGDGEVEITGLSHDSRKVAPGWMFAALPGEKSHGTEFLTGALDAGAAAVLSDRSPEPELSVPWIQSATPRRTMAILAWLLAGDPQERLHLVGVTGTNGKTTTAGLIASILETAGHSVGCFGTLEYRLPGRAIPAARTTPEATDLAPLLGDLARSGGEYAVLEVSSHAIDRNRVAGLTFDTAVWTNLSRDHLDYHGDMESYFEVKKRLFTEYRAAGGRQVIPVDEPWGRKLLELSPETTISYGIKAGSVHACDLRSDLDGSSFKLILPDGQLEVHLPLIGLHNLRNALAATAAAVACGQPIEAIGSALEAACPERGRLERIETRLGFPIFVDFAHTPDGLDAVLSSLRAVTNRRLVVVFGAGGDRDRGKRQPMGHAVGTHADVVIVTSDNPRSEDPEVIARDVTTGVVATGTTPEIILDRRAAISRALEIADSKSLVVVAGKGHERDQLIGDRRIPFDDATAIREIAGGSP